MTKKRQAYSEEFRREAIRRSEQPGNTAASVAKELGLHPGQIYNWRRHFGSMDSADVKRLRELEQENARLKKMVADRDLEIDVMKEIAAKKW